MFRLLKLLLVASALPSLAYNYASTKQDPTNCGQGCSSTLGLVTFGDMNVSSGFYASKCNSVYWTTSMYVCMQKYCDDQDFKASWDQFSIYCVEYGASTLMTVEDTKAAVTPNAPVVDCLNVSPKDVYNTTVMPDDHSGEAGQLTLVVWGKETIYHHAFGWALYIMVAIILLAGMLNKVFTWYMIRLARTANFEPAEFAPSQGIWTNTYTLYRKHISVPALLGYRHCQTVWGCQLPTRLQSFFIFAYVAVNFIFSCAVYDIFNENLYYPNAPGEQIARYVADRTGIMSFYNMPLLWALAGRNDVLLWLTGWSYTTMNKFHRWVAFVATMQAIAHSAAYTWIEREILAEEAAEQYWWTGIIATICMSLLLPLSIRAIRQRFYEFFLISHILLALGSLVGCFYHVKIWDGDYDGWMWACTAIWLFDRFLRYIRIAILSFRTNKTGGNTIASITSQNGLIRLTTTTAIPITPKPGHYYYLYTPRSITPWENHPFTLASWEKGANGGTDLHFLIAPHKGATRKLQKRIAQAESGVTMRILLEGPYGHTDALEPFDHVLLVAGGSGVTAILPYLFTIRQNNSHNSRIRHVTVVWVVKQANYAADVLARELAPTAKLAGLDVQINVYISREVGAKPQDVVNALPEHVESEHIVNILPASAPAGNGSPQSDHEEKFSDNDSKSSSDEVSAALIPGRPEMAEVLRRAVRRLVGAERLAVVACGPGGMCDGLRSAIIATYGSGEGQVSGSTIEYFEESFTW
nr:uncharacterized protein CI109_006739 [Kwoniella shandongensis]KAA5524939.1 hypothetical protein CI109_006739 [Kwoniella shandongensis]